MGDIELERYRENERMREKTIQGGELILNEVDKSIFEMWSPLCLNLP